MEQSQKVLRLSDEINLELLKLQTATEEFVVTGNNSIRDSNTNSFNLVNEKLSSLQLLTNYNPTQTASVDSLKVEINEYLLLTKSSMNGIATSPNSKVLSPFKNNQRIKNDFSKPMLKICQSLDKDLKYKEN